MCKSLSKWHFDVENDKLVDLVLDGKKTAYVDNIVEKSKRILDMSKEV